MKLAGETVGGGTGFSQGGTDLLQTAAGLLPAAGGRFGGKRVIFISGQLLAQQVPAEPGLPEGGFRPGQLLAALGAPAQQGVGGGNVIGGGGEAADLQQDALLIGGERAVQGVGGGGAGIQLRLGCVPGLQ